MKAAKKTSIISSPSCSQLHEEQLLLKFFSPLVKQLKRYFFRDEAVLSTRDVNLLERDN